MDPSCNLKFTLSARNSFEASQWGYCGEIHSIQKTFVLLASKLLFSDSSTPPVDMQCNRFLNDYGVDHVELSPYYPQGNCQVEAANKTLLRVLSKKAYEELKRWVDFLSHTLQDYCTSNRISIQATISLQCTARGGGLSQGDGSFGSTSFCKQII